jgi:hypothetical protein
MQKLALVIVSILLAFLTHAHAQSNQGVVNEILTALSASAEVVNCFAQSNNCSSCIATAGCSYCKNGVIIGVKFNCCLKNSGTLKQSYCVF